MESFFSLLFALLFLTMIGDFILSTFWVPFYYRFGIPLFRRTFKLIDAPSDLEKHIPSLEAQLQPSWGRAGVVFRAISTNELAFRHSLKRNSRNVVHGRVHYDAFNQQLTMTGHLYFPLLLFPFFALPFTYVDPFNIMFFVVAILIVIINGVMQRSNYGRIAAALEKTLQITPWSDDFDGSSSYDPLAPSPAKLPGLSTSELMLGFILLSMLILAGAVFAAYWFGR